MAEGEVKKRGLQAVEVNFSPVKDRTIGDVFGTDTQAITKVNQKVWALIRENNLRVSK